jgi:hypothetical protein
MERLTDSLSIKGLIPFHLLSRASNVAIHHEAQCSRRIQSGIRRRRGFVHTKKKLVAWSVGDPQTFQIKGYDATAWGISYTGQGLGRCSAGYDHAYSKGTVKRVWTFDSIYGIFIGISDSGDYTKDRQGEGWTEKSSDTAQIDDTNLAFSVQTTQTTSQSEYTTSTPSLYTEIWTVASTTTETVATSQDMWLNQLGEKFPGGLIGLVGIIAIVVVLLAVTVARRNRKSAPPTPPGETRGSTLPEGI